MSKPEKVIPDKVIGFKSDKPSYDQVFSQKDSIIYSLGIGFSKDPLDEADLKYTYELNEDFSVFPTVATTLNDVKEMFSSLVSCPGMPQFNPMMLLHGEQHFEILKPIRAGFRLISEAKCVDIADKGKGAYVTFEVITYEEEEGKKTPVVKQYSGLFIRGIGGFGHKGKINFPINPPPKRDPCKVFSDKTEPNQAILYRLAGDVNPLHIDPNMASAGGFDKPILHGLCTYGIAGKHIVKGWCDNKPELLKKMGGRFTSHVFPGETLKIKTWKEGNLILFTAETVERGLVVLQGYAEILAGGAKL